MMAAVQSFFRLLERSSEDSLFWNEDLKPHATGDFSMAAIQANAILEDQAQVLPIRDATFVGVYDGHGGHQAARFVNSSLLPHLLRLNSEHGELRWDKLLKMAFCVTEEEFLSLVDRSWPMWPELLRAGTCCLVGVVTKSAVYLANLGDCRAVIGRQGMGGLFVTTEQLTVDYNVQDPRIRAEVAKKHPNEPNITAFANGSWRIKGKIQVSKTIGDVYLKRPEFSREPELKKIAFADKPPISALKESVLDAEPHIVLHDRQQHDLFLIFASDGLWQYFTNEQAVDMVFKNPRKGIAKRLVKGALKLAEEKVTMTSGAFKNLRRGNERRPHHDDITVVVIYLDHQFTKDEINPNFEAEANNCTFTPADIYTFSTHGLGSGLRPESTSAGPSAGPSSAGPSAEPSAGPSAA